MKKKILFVVAVLCVVVFTFAVSTIAIAHWDNEHTVNAQAPSPSIDCAWEEGSPYPPPCFYIPYMVKALPPATPTPTPTLPPYP